MRQGTIISDLPRSETDLIRTEMLITEGVVRSAETS